MKPKPFASLNHFTVPVFTGNPFFSAKTKPVLVGRRRTRRQTPRPDLTGSRIRGRSTIQKGRQLVAGGPNLLRELPPATESKLWMRPRREGFSVIVPSAGPHRTCHPAAGSGNVRPVMRALLFSTLALLLSASPSHAARRSPAGPSTPLSPGAHKVTIAGVEIAYHVAGSGPVILVHPGGPGI